MTPHTTSRRSGSRLTRAPSCDAAALLMCVRSVLWLGFVGFTTIVAVASISAEAQSGSFTPTSPMVTARSQHTATLLPNGTVFIAGGVESTTTGTSILASTELYDPATDRFTPAATMTTTRRGHTATVLPDGRVLIAGGYGGDGPTWGSPLASAELYDPSSDRFTTTGDLITATGFHTALLLPSGKVLIVGGSGIGTFPNNVAPAELYDPSVGTFTAAGTYVGRSECDFCAPSVLLADGTVLFPDQYPAQIYDPTTNAFTVTGMMITDQSAATLLPNGTVLFAGGESLSRTATAELYDPKTGAYSATGSMTVPRVWHTLTLLPSGLVLATGGETDSCSGMACSFAGTVRSAELYDPSAGVFHATADMTTAREGHTATVLADGRVLLAGGVSYGGIGLFDGSVSSAEVYRPDVLVPTPSLLSLPGDHESQGAIYHARTSYVAGIEDPAIAGDEVDVLCMGLSANARIPPQVAIGGRLAEIVSLGDAPGRAGARTIRVRVPRGVTTGSAVPVRLTYLGRPSNGVTMAVK